MIYSLKWQSYFMNETEMSNACQMDRVMHVIGLDW